MDIKEAKDKSTALEIIKIVAPWLSLPIGTLILALVPQVRDRIWPATPKGLLLALLIVSLSAILGLVPWAIGLRRKLKVSVLDRQALSAEVANRTRNAGAREAEFRKALGENTSLYNRVNELEAENEAFRKRINELLEKHTTLELQQALAHLYSFSENLPKNSDIEEKFVTEYHDILSRIEKEADHNLNTFRISPNEVAHYVIRNHPKRIGHFSYGPANPTRLSEKRYCNRALFLTRLHGVIKFLNL
jgi:hypothetical protein